MSVWRSRHSFPVRLEPLTDPEPYENTDVKVEPSSEDASGSHKVALEMPGSTLPIQITFKSMVSLENEVYQRVQDWPEDGDEESVKSDAESVD